ncbi:MAG: IS21 family transposase, partial [Gammaproteobacteria bacterium]
TGPTTARMVAEILHRRRHPEQGYRACLGLMRLGRQPGPERLEAACARAERFLAYSYRAVKNILTAGLDRLPLQELDTPTAPLPVHENIRGAAYDTFGEQPRC